MQLRPLIQSVKQPRQPGAVTFQERHSQFGKLLQNSTGAKLGDCQDQFHGIAQRQGDDVSIWVSEKFVGYLILLRISWRMEAKRDAEPFNLRPQTIKMTVVNEFAIDWLGAKR